MLPIRIIDSNFNLLGEVDNYQSLQLFRDWHGIGTLEMHINRYKAHVDKLVRRNILFTQSNLHNAYIIKHREIELDESGKITENWSIQAQSLKSILAQRITIPPVGQEFDKVEGDAETVMKYYVDKHLVNPTDSKRKIPNLVIAPNQNRGVSLLWESKYANVATEVETISRISGLGWNIYLDLVNQQFVFDVYEGRDVTSSQSELPPVVFSTQFENVKNLKYTDSDLNFKNTAYVGGPGEGTNRYIEEVGDTDGFDRYEVFLEARDLDTNQTENDIRADMYLSGIHTIMDYDTELYLEGQILTKSSFVYEKDYKLGDIVTIREKEWGVSTDTRITGFLEVYEAGNEYIEATFGNNIPTIIDKVKQEISQVKGAIRK